MSKRLPAIHPGEILLEEFMKPMGLSSNALAGALGVTPRVFMKSCGESAVSAPTRPCGWPVFSAQMRNRG